LEKLRYRLPRLFPAVVLSELLLRIAFTQSFLLERLDTSEAANYYRWLALRRNKQAFIYSFDTYHLELGWISKPSLRVVPAFDGKTVSTNGDGLRGSVDYPPEPGPRPRVLFLGYLTIDRRRNVVAFRDYVKPKFELAEKALLLTNSPERCWDRVGSGSV